MIRVLCNIYEGDILTKKWLLTTKAIAQISSNSFGFLAKSPFGNKPIQVEVVIPCTEGSSTIAENLIKDALAYGYIDVRKYKATIIPQ